MKTYIGIDPGAKGFMCVFRNEEYMHIPLRENPKDKDINPEVVKILCEISKEDCICCIEEVHAIHGQGVSSTFTFGQNFGMIIGVILAFGIPYTFVKPQKWQNEMVTSPDKCASSPKHSSYNAARRLHPKIDFRRDERKKTFDDNKVDATLICDYAIRNRL